MSKRKRTWVRDVWRGTGGLLLGSALVATGVAPATAGAQTEDHVRVFYPRGECETGVIEIEVFHRASSAWQRHPAHWRIPAATCQEELAGILLQEIRYRCVDPDSPSRASAWTVGVDVFESVSADRCAPSEPKQ